MGGVRTALYNYLFARKHNGTFILRLEDTDQTRFVSGAEAYILNALKWAGIHIDEGVEHGGPHGPYRQSERKEMYRQYADQLVASGHAYYAFDTTEELDEMREMMKQAGVPSPQYNQVTRTRMKNSLSLSAEEVERRLSAGEPYVIRIKMPRNEEVRFHDIIRGWVVVNTNNMDDKVMFKSDGMPTYHLANVVDDRLMKITHVIRGEEWLPSAPLHVLLYRYFGWEEGMPQFAHLPLILKPDGNGKLSKRDGDRLGFPVFPLQWLNEETGELSSGYKERGYFPEAFVNMLAFLGWNPGTAQELFSMDELIDTFSLERVGKAGARFDPDKTKWFNQQYLRAKTNEELGQLMEEQYAQKGVKTKGLDLAAIANLMKERASFVHEMVEEAIFFFETEIGYDQTAVEKKWNAESKELLVTLAEKFGQIEKFEATNIDAAFHTFMEERGVGFGKIGPALRLALTGKGMGPSLFDIAQILGKEETLRRMKAAIEKLP
jgi:glutamyl-tRNA synthetase